MDKDTKINEMEISDEFTLAHSNESIKEIAVKLQKLQKECDSGTVLITQDDEVIGYISERELVDVIADEKDTTSLKGSDLMNNDYVEVLEDETLGEIIPLITKKYPNAIVVIDSKRRCVGYFSKNDYMDAMAELGIYDKSRTPKTTDEWCTRGIALSTIGKKIEALKCFERSVEKKSNKEKGWTDLAKRLERINKLKDAISCYDQALTINSDNVEALTEKGNIYSKEKTENLAILSYQKALDINPDNVEVLLNMGLEQADAGEIEEALKCMDKAITIKGENAELWFKKGNVFDKAKKYEDALDCYERAINIDKKFEDAWFNKGAALNMLGKDKETLECLREILKINPNNENAKEAIANYEANQ